MRVGRGVGYRWAVLGLLLVAGASALSGCQKSAPSAVSAVPDRSSHPLARESGALKALPLDRVMATEDRHRMCSGVFVAPGLFLTAAHCVDDVRGLAIRRFAKKTLTATSWEKAPGRNAETGANDIALVTFPSDAGSFPYGDKLVDVDYFKPLRSQRLVFAGYAPVGLKAEKAQEAQTRNAGNATISVGITSASGLTRGADAPFDIVTLGAEDGGSFPQRGDSGGPLFAQDAAGKWVVIGVVARGDSERSYFAGLAEPRVKAWLEERIAAARARAPAGAAGWGWPCFGKPAVALEK